MKKVLLILGVGVFTAVGVNAQQGSWYLGGNVGFNSSKSKVQTGSTIVENPQTTNWAFSPEVGTFLTNNVQLGIAPTVGGSKIEDGNSTSYLGGTLYSRYFWGTQAFKPFAGIAVSYTGGNTKNDDGDKLSTNTNFGANLNAGFGYALSSRVTAVGSFGVLGYSQQVSKSEIVDAKQTTSSFGLDAGSLGSRFNVGVYVTL